MRGKKFFHQMTNINKSGPIESQGCNAICFYSPSSNTGTLYVNDIPVPSGCILSLEGLEGERDMTIYNVKYDSTIAGDYFYFIAKFYTDDYNTANS